MKIVKIKLANHVIGVRYLFQETVDFLKEYCTSEEELEFEIAVEKEDIIWEREKSESEDLRKGIAIRSFSDIYLESLAIYRKIAKVLIEEDVLLFHGSVVAVDGNGYLFTAKSGIGKSTHTRLWREYFGERAVMVNDDKPLLGITRDGVIAYGTPWSGKHRLSNNIAVPLKGVGILERDAINHIEILDKRSAYSMIVQQAYRSDDSASILKAMELIDRIMEHVPIYRLRCNMEIEAAKVAYEGMQG